MVMLRVFTFSLLMVRRPDSMLRTVRKRLVEGKDYLQEAVELPGGRNKINVLPSALGLRKLMMVTRGPRVEALQGYFALVA